MTDTFAHITELASVLSARNGDGRAEMTAQMLKLSEEVGEVAQAWIGYIGQNPRKGVTHTLEDVMSELADVAITALVGIARLDRDPERVLGEKVAVMAQRYAELDTALATDIARGDTILSPRAYWELEHDWAAKHLGFPPHCPPRDPWTAFDGSRWIYDHDREVWIRSLVGEPESPREKALADVAACTAHLHMPDGVVIQNIVDAAVKTARTYVENEQGREAFAREHLIAAADLMAYAAERMGADR